jgi:hypothetical protein
LRTRYTSAKRQLLSNKVLKLSDGVPVHIAASLAAGTVATTVCAPADVLKSRLQSAASVNGKAPVRKPNETFRQCWWWTGFGEDIRDLAEEWRARILDERMDSGVAETSVSHEFWTERPRTDCLRPNTILMFLFMEQLQRLVAAKTLWSLRLFLSPESVGKAKREFLLLEKNWHTTRSTFWALAVEIIESKSGTMRRSNNEDLAELALAQEPERRRETRYMKSTR